MPRRGALGYIERRYSPPTSNNAWLIWPRLATRVAFISSANTLPPESATSRSRASAASVSLACFVWNARTRSICVAFLVVRCARELQVLRLFVAAAIRVLERVHSDDRQSTRVLEVLVLQALVLDLRALVLALHRSEHAAALVEPQELLEHRLFHELGELLGDERALQRILALREALLLRDDRSGSPSLAARSPRSAS